MNMKKTIFFIGFVFLFAVLLTAQTSFTPESRTNASAIQSPLRSTSLQHIAENEMSFTQNKGQIVDMQLQQRPDVLFKAASAGMVIYLRKTGVSYVANNMEDVMREVEEQVEASEKIGDKVSDGSNQRKIKENFLAKQMLKLHRIDVDFENCNSNAQVVTSNKMEGCSNYYYAHCPQGITKINSYNTVIQKNIYNNIDVKYYGGKSAAGGLKYDILVNPGADADQIKLKYSGAKGVTLKNGKLQIETSLETLIEYIPKVYQNINGQMVDVQAEYNLAPSPSEKAGGETFVSFKLGKWNQDYPLIIDPYAWATYYGGSNWDTGSEIATDVSGDALVVGTTWSTDFPVTPGAYQTLVGGNSDAYVVKFNPNGGRLWATYYGGGKDDTGDGIATDAASNVVITGGTASTNFPVTIGAFQTLAAAFGDVFVVKLNPAGLQVWATYYGGNNNDNGYAIATDAASNVVITGSVSSTNFPVTAGAFQPAKGSGAFTYDAFVVKFNSAGGQMWSTYYGGSNDDQGYAIAVDATGNIIITGGSSSTDFPVTPTAFQTTSGAFGDAFVVKITPAGSRLWATYYGGNDSDEGYGIATDAAQNIVINGNTTSTDLVTSAASFQPAYGGGPVDAFIVKFNSAGGQLWATYHGGNNWERSSACAIDQNSNIYVLGEWEDMNNGNFPMNTCALQKTFSGTIEDWYVTKFNSNGKRICSTFIGGTGEIDLDNGGGGIATFANYVYITGNIYSGTFPVTSGAFQTAFAGGNSDAIVAKFCGNSCGENNNIVAGFNYPASLCANSAIQFNSSVTSVLSCDLNSNLYHWYFPGANPSSSTQQNPSGVVYPAAGTYTVSLVVDATCSMDSVSQVITISNCAGCVFDASATVVSDVSCNGANNGSAVAGPTGAIYSYSWLPLGATGRTATNLPAGTYTVTVSTPFTMGGCTATAIVTITEPPIINAPVFTSINAPCGTNNGSVTASASGGTPPYVYLWSNSQTNATATGLSAGTYTVTITDANGCFTTGNVIIPLPIIAQYIKGTANCADCGCKEWIMVTASSGAAPYNYLWPALGAYDKRYKNKLCAGNYTIQVTDKKGCTVNVVVNAP
jgi:hypothetical protein